MQFSISGEISHLHSADLIPAKFSRARNQVEETLNRTMADKGYGDTIQLLFLAPIILQDGNSFFIKIKERKLIKQKERTAEFRLRIDYLKFFSADDTTRERLLVKNVIDAVRIIQKRLKKKFDGNQLENDILTLRNVNYVELEWL